MTNYDYLIVGSGLFGATFAYFAHKAGKRCLVIDKRPQLGGNVYCRPFPVPSLKGQGESVINVHQYGAHIFHTNNKEVWNFVNSLVEFNRYTNCPVANYKGELYNLPFNMNTFCQMWKDVHTPEEAKTKIASQVHEAVEQINARHIEQGYPLLTPAPLGEGWEGAINLEEQALCLVGKDIFEKLIKEYTEKQWGRSCKDLPAFIIRRLPVRFVFDNNYFNDRYQGIPIGGYNKLIAALLNLPSGEVGRKAERLIGGEGIGLIDTKVNCDFFKEYKDNWREVADKLVYTGPLDEYFDYKLGRLDWRTVTFKTRLEDTPNYQGNAVINYTSHNEPYTRVIEHKHFEMFGQAVYDCQKTVVSEEYSTEYKSGMEQYYPVNDEKNNALAEQYRELAIKEENVIFGGRLAEYKYYDMAPIIEKVMGLF